MLELSALAECTLQTLEDGNDYRVRSSSPFIYKGSPPNPETPGMPSRILEVWGCSELNYPINSLYATCDNLF
jgi:hypothetical protein